MSRSDVAPGSVATPATVGVAPGVGRDRPRRRPSQRVPARRGGRAGRPVCGGQGGRLRARGGAPWPGPRWKAGPPGWRWRRLKRAWHLRDAGIVAPVLVLSEPPAEAMADVVGRGLTLALYSRRGRGGAGAASARAGVVTDVHVKVDTGMHRVGAPTRRAPRDRPSRGGAAVASLRGVVDALPGGRRRRTTRTGPSPTARCEVSVRPETLLARAGHAPPMLHAANSAGALAYPAARLDMVRCGIALYGVSPFPVVDAAVDRVDGRTPGPGRCVRCCRCGPR